MTLNSSSRPIVELIRIETFSASHRLHSEFLTPEKNKEIFGKCNNPNGHGHNYRWEVSLRGPVDEKSGMVYNLENLKREMSAVLDLVDHKNLDIDVDYFRENKMVTTSENVAMFLYDSLKERMEKPDLLWKVKVHETDKNAFVYKGQKMVPVE
jgi:6-pyruvoyltetrahydropterin/6-carboxytetrahydropterin synthase